MSLRVPTRLGQQFLLEDFSGGLDMGSAYDELPLNRSPFAQNVVFDVERGAVMKRLGFPIVSSTAPGLGPLFYWPAQNRFIIQAGATLYKTTSAFSVFTSFATLSTSAEVGMCEFNGFLVVAHPVDGVFTYDNTTFTLRNATVLGNSCAAWQNKVWVGGVGTTVWWSNAGTAVTWTTASDFVNIREKDDRPVTMVGTGGSGMDVSGRPGLLVFKADSTYRINNSSTGAYTMLDGEAGAGNAQSAATIGSDTLVLNSRGVYLTDGITFGLRRIHSRLGVFGKLSVSVAGAGCVAAGDRFLLWASSGGSGAFAGPSLVEYHPGYDTFSRHRTASLWPDRFIAVDRSTDSIYATRAGSIHQLFSGPGDEAGGTTAFDSYYTTAAITLAGRSFQIPQVDFRGRGTSLEFLTRKDYDTLAANEVSQTVSLPNDANKPVLSQRVFDLGYARAFQFRVRQSSADAVYTAPDLRGTEGAWALYGLTVHAIPLGRL